MPDGTSRVLPFCGPACATWTAKARQAVRDGDGDAATALLDVERHLNARETPQQRVPGLLP
ncbi:hypothetical protein [Streptomyces griseoluteus]|uniref:hypothetical protein n=1 Tax=Streptomyces griseoluteus TaxID=29306 RepID=UPI003665C676